MLNGIVTMLCAGLFPTANGTGMLQGVCVTVYHNSGWNMLNRVVTMMCAGLSPTVGGTC